MLLVFLCIPFGGLADSLSDQLKKYSVQELYQLYTAVEKELVSRGGSENMKLINGGRYVVGTNIPAGTYELILYKGMFGIGEAYIYASMDDYRASKPIDTIEMMGTGSKGRITLEEGSVLVIDSYYEFFIKKVEEKVFEF